MDTTPKPWYLSTGIQGGIVAGIGLVMSLLSAHYGWAIVSNDALTATVADVMQVVGIVMGIYGRLTAKQVIG